MRPAAATCLVLAAALSSVAASGDAVPAAAAAREPKDGAVALRPVAGAPALVHAADQKPLPSCGDVNNCFDCFFQAQILKKLECTANPFGGEPLCSPCGWCASNVTGECVMAPTGIIDFCQLVDPGADRYCPESVCKVGGWGCACKDNVCPAVEKLIGIFTIEGLWIILLCVGSFGVCLATLCVWCVCGSGPGRRVVIEHRYPADVETRLEQQNAGGFVTNLNIVATGDYSRFD